MQMGRALTRTVGNLVLLKSQDKGKKDARDGGQYTVPSGPKCFRCQGFGHMKQECPTYLKTIGKSKALAAMLIDIELEDDFDNEDERNPKFLHCHCQSY